MIAARRDRAAAGISRSTIRRDAKSGEDCAHSDGKVTASNRPSVLRYQSSWWIPMPRRVTTKCLKLAGFIVKRPKAANLQATASGMISLRLRSRQFVAAKYSGPGTQFFIGISQRGRQMLELRYPPTHRIDEQHLAAVRQIIAEGLAAKAQHGNRAGNQAIIDKIGLEARLVQGEGYWGEALDYHLGLLYAHIGQPE